MSGREAILLGTASQVPTRQRAHHATLVRIDGTGVLFDPGEGTQRQLTLAGVAMSGVHHVAVTHAHGDHCLGLPGVLQRAALDEIRHPLHVHYPTAADRYIRRLRHASAYEDRAEVHLHPSEPGALVTDGPIRLEAAPLAHGIPTLGYRLSTPSGWRLDPDRASAAGVEGPDRAELVATGSVQVAGERVRIEQVATPRRGLVVAFVMDTGWCDGALELAADADLLVVEATFLEGEAALAEEVGHLTAAQAARLAVEAGARRVVLTHLSQRYPDIDGHLAEARTVAPHLDVHVARDLDRIAIR